MIITEKNKMKDLPKISLILSCSQTNLMEEILKFSVPIRVGKYEVRDFQKIEIGEMMEIWDMKTDEELKELTARICLINPKKKIDINNLPLIDFLRLTKYVEKISVYSGNKFKSCKPKNIDSRIESIYNKYESDPFEMVSRFCELYPAYKLEEAKKMAWTIVYYAFKKRSKDNDIQTEINNLK